MSPEGCPRQLDNTSEERGIRRFTARQLAFVAAGGVALGGLLGVGGVAASEHLIGRTDVAPNNQTPPDATKEDPVYAQLAEVAAEAPGMWVAEGAAFLGGRDTTEGLSSDLPYGGTITWAGPGGGVRAARPYVTQTGTLEGVGCERPGQSTEVQLFDKAGNPTNVELVGTDPETGEVINVAVSPKSEIFERTPWGVVSSELGSQAIEITCVSVEGQDFGPGTVPVSLRHEGGGLWGEPYREAIGQASPNSVVADWQQRRRAAGNSLGKDPIEVPQAAV